MKKLFTLLVIVAIIGVFSVQCDAAPMQSVASFTKAPTVSIWGWRGWFWNWWNPPTADPVEPEDPIEPEPPEPPVVVLGPNPRVGACYLHDGVLGGRDDETLAMFWAGVKEAKIGRVRYDVAASVVNPAPGVWDLDRIKKFFDGKPDDVQVILTFYNNALWNIERRAEVEQAMAWAQAQYPNAEERIPSGAPADADAFREFVRTVVERYHDRGLWLVQFENEIYGVSRHIAGLPPFGTFWLGYEDDYKKTVRAGLAGVNDVDPSIHVAIAGVTTECAIEPQGAYGRIFNWALTLEPGMADRIIADEHLYCCQEDDRARIAALRRIVGGVKLISTETGEIDPKCEKRKSYLGSVFDAQAEQKQADLLDARLNALLDEDVDFCLLRLQAPNKDNEGRYNRWWWTTLIEKDGRRRLAFYVVQTIAEERRAE